MTLLEAAPDDVGLPGKPGNGEGVVAPGGTVNKHSHSSGQSVGIVSVGRSWLQYTELSGTRHSGQLQTSTFVCWNRTCVHHGSTFHEHEVVGEVIVLNVGQTVGERGTSPHVIVSPSVVSTSWVVGQFGVAPGRTDIDDILLVRVAVPTVVNVDDPEVVTTENVVVMMGGTEEAVVLAAGWLGDGDGLAVAEVTDEEEGT